MIEFVEGKLTHKSPSHVVMQSGGFGVRAAISLNTYDALPVVGETVRLWTYLQMRDDEIELFAFASQEERWVFRHLISVNGVGPRLAVTALSAAKPDVIRRAIAEGDGDRLKSIPRIGSKIAERIVLELKKKLAGDVPEFAVAGDGKTGGVREALDALVALGFTRDEAQKAVDAAVKHGGKTTEDLVKLALRSS
jgi:holliday junction DNA helicase RuvA